MRHFRSIDDVSGNELTYLVDLALELKRERLKGTDRLHAPRPILGLLFEKPSMRTRVSFESGIAHVGGSSIFLSGEEVGLGKRESVADFARVIGNYVDLLAVRTFAHGVVLELAKHACCPVINALSDDSHPCQALSDICTIKEHFGRWNDLRLAFVGDGNNVAQSLAKAAAKCGLSVILSAPPGYQFTDDFMRCANRPGLPGSVSIEPDPQKAVAQADIVYTDVWASMGQEAEHQERARVFASYQVNAQLMALAKPEACFLHCLPAHRGEEVTDEVIDGPQSLVVEQAGNRLHAQKALMLWLLAKRQVQAAPAESSKSP